MAKVAGWIVQALRASGDDARLDALREEVEAFCLRFPVPGI